MCQEASGGQEVEPSYNIAEIETLGWLATSSVYA
jgi:hypothetical protein